MPAVRSVCTRLPEIWKKSWNIKYLRRNLSAFLDIPLEEIQDLMRCLPTRSG